jgi:bifunctional non-homologous end joining protein LigD
VSTLPGQAVIRRSHAAADPRGAPYTKKIAHKGIWVEPELLAEIEYRARSAEGKVRHPFFKGLREDQ